MAHSSAAGTVTVGGTAIASILSVGLDTSVELIDATTMTDDAKVQIAGTKSYSGSLECFWSETDSGQLALIEGASATLVFAFEGNTSGDYIYTLSTIVTGVNISAAKDSMVTASFSFAGTGSITRGTV